MRAKGPKADLALVVADTPAAAAGVFTTNVMAAAPVTYCREVLAGSGTARAVRLPLSFQFACSSGFQDVLAAGDRDLLSQRHPDELALR